MYPFYNVKLKFHGLEKHPLMTELGDSFKMLKRLERTDQKQFAISPTVSLKRKHTKPVLSNQSEDISLSANQVQKTKPTNPVCCTRYLPRLSLVNTISVWFLTF